MNFKRAGFVFLFVACVAHVNSNAVDLPSIKYTFDEVNELYNNFLVQGNTTIQNAHIRLNQVRNKTLQLKAQTISTVSAELNGITAAFLQEISNLEAQAKQYVKSVIMIKVQIILLNQQFRKTLSIASCVADSRTQITNLPGQALSAVSECIVSPENTILNNINNVSVTVDNSFNEWNKVFSTELNQCKSEAESLQDACASTLGTKIGQVISSFPAAVSQQVEQVESQFPPLTHEYVKCSTNQVAAVSSRAAVIVADVTGCANELFFTAITPTTPAAITTPAAPPAPAAPNTTQIHTYRYTVAPASD